MLVIAALREFNRLLGSNIVTFLCDVEPGPRYWLQHVDRVLHGLKRESGRSIKVTATCNASIFISLVQHRGSERRIA